MNYNFYQLVCITFNLLITFHFTTGIEGKQLSSFLHLSFLRVADPTYHHASCSTGDDAGGHGEEEDEGGGGGGHAVGV